MIFLDLVVSSNFSRVFFEACAAAFIAPAFAMLFSVDRKYLIFILFGGFITRFVRSLLFLSLHMEIAIATFLAVSLTSLIFVYLGPKLKAPRPIFLVASIISLIPGMDAYNALLALIELIDATSPQDISTSANIMLSHGIRAMTIMISIALGIAIPPLFFYRYRYHHL